MEIGSSLLTFSVTANHFTPTLQLAKFSARKSLAKSTRARETYVINRPILYLSCPHRDMSSNKRETSFPQPSSKESIWGSIYKTNKAASSKKQAQQCSCEIGQSYMVSSMFLEPTIPWGHLQVYLLNSNTLAIRSFVSQESYILLPKLVKVNPSPLPPQKKTWAACNSFWINLFQAWTE